MQRISIPGDRHHANFPAVPEMHGDYVHAPRSLAYLKEDVFFTRPGAGNVLYAARGTRVQVMVWDPTQPEKPYGVRAESEQYRNVQVPESILSLTPIQTEGL